MSGAGPIDVPPPGGESLKDTAARALPYYEAEIAPKAEAGKTVLVAAHGNSLRALVMKLENLTPRSRSSPAKSPPASRSSTRSPPTASATKIVG